MNHTTLLIFKLVAETQSVTQAAKKHLLQLHSILL